MRCCSSDKFIPFYLPDVAVYHDFVTKYAQDYDFVLYCQNDIIFQNSTKEKALDHWTNILRYDSEYSIIAEMRTVCNHNLSLRFHCCFIFTNTKKFCESKLSFINNDQLIDPAKFNIYANGGTGLLTSFYKKHDTKSNWRPYLINIHGVYRDRSIMKNKDKGFDHIAAVEWNRKQDLSEGGSVERTQKIYKEANEYVTKYLSSINCYEI